ncbi:MAG: DUF1385 domain-containing protein [Armatimonadota bacterium]|nr:MAG: DUF1385 domain-containing protein [Armatimonadota bacterium]
MVLRDIRNIIKTAPPLAPDDTVAKAVRILRARALPALPVADQGRLIGLVQEADILALVADAPDPAAVARSLPARHIMRPIELILSDTQPLPAVAQALRDSADAAVPVVAPDGRYLGMLLRRDLLAALSGQPLAPPIAGLATPFGIYLTTGALRAGAHDFALAATGAALMVINLLANGIVYGLLWLADRLLFGGSPQPPPQPPDDISLLAVVIFFGLQIAVFLVLLRLSPLAGVHGAEHMVVHAIEEGEDLQQQKIKAMPRVHPRCGTNIMALLILLIIAQQSFTSLSGEVDEPTRLFTFVALVFVILLTWRRLGAGLQRWITTRRPSDRQLGSALIVAETLLDKVRANPGARASFPRRLWNSGFPQVVSGFVAVALLIEYAGPLLSEAWTWLRAF